MGAPVIALYLAFLEIYDDKNGNNGLGMYWSRGSNKS